MMNHKPHKFDFDGLVILLLIMPLIPAILPLIRYKKSDAKPIKIPPINALQGIVISIPIELDLSI